MIKRIIFFSLFALLMAAIVLGFFLRQTHKDIDTLNPDLPSVDQVMASRRGIEVVMFPTKIEVNNTASQMLPVSTVLEGGDDTKMYEMSFPAFVITWPNGKQFMVDAGLTELEAEAFGAPSESLGAEPMQVKGAITKLTDLSKLDGLAFTHMHIDHIDGTAGLCESLGDKSVQLVQTLEQYSMTNYMTEDARQRLAALPCSTPFVIKDKNPLKPVSGFPGLFVVHTAGHTPGSQVFIVNVRDGIKIQTYVLTGDIVNHGDGIVHNISKPTWYSYLMVPENLEQLDKTRRWIEDLTDQDKVDMLVSHDMAQIRTVLPHSRPDKN